MFVSSILAIYGEEFNLLFLLIKIHLISNENIFVNHHIECDKKIINENNFFGGFFILAF